MSNKRGIFVGKGINHIIIIVSFAEAKQYHGLRFARMLGIQNMREQCFLTAAVQNMKRLAKAFFIFPFFHYDKGTILLLSKIVPLLMV